MTSGPLDLPHVATPRRLVLSRGNLFSVTDPSGDIVPAGARELGVFFQDTRHLSHYALLLPGHAPTLLSSDTETAVSAQIDLTTTDEEVGGLLGEPIHFLHVRRRQILDRTFTDRIILTNHLGRGVEFDVWIVYAVDFADVFEVRGAIRPARGLTLPPVISEDGIRLEYLTVTAETYRTVIRFEPRPVEITADRARFRVRLAPGESAEIQVTAIPERGDYTAPADVGFGERVQRLRDEAASFLAGCTRIRCDNASVSRVLSRSLGDLHALRILHDRKWIVGAGIPWFAAPFGRDSIITSMQALPFVPALASETLRFLAHWQGQKDDLCCEEEPGRILHELRRGEMAAAGEIPHRPYYGSVDATPLFVVLAAEAWRWTHDLVLFEETWPAVKAAMAWLERRTEDGTKMLTYLRATPRGLENQAWKDSRDAVCFPDGTLAEGPIAMVEVQGYVAQAWLCGALLARARGDTELAARWASHVDGFVGEIDRRFWNEQTHFYAMALDRTGAQVPTLSSNPGHLLWSRSVPPSRARRVAEVLLSPEMYSGWGIRTLARGQIAYNPISYHNGSVWPHDNAIAALGLAHYDIHDAVLRITEGMFSAAEHFQQSRLPELFCGMPRGEREFLVHYPVSCSPQAWASGATFMLLQACLGLEADAPAGVLRVRNPTLPGFIRRLDLSRMKVGRALVSLRFQRTGRRTHADVLDVAGGPMRVEIEVE